MADMNADRMRLLGFLPAGQHAQGYAALGSVAGPPLSLRHGPHVVAVLQQEAGGPAAGRPIAGGIDAALLAGLHVVQRRLEAACQAGPFLAMDPAAACCPEDLVDGLLDPAWRAIEAALALHGARHQWDLVLRWKPELVVARRRPALAEAAARGTAALAEAVAAALREERVRREAGLRATLADAVLGLADGGGAVAEAEVHVTVLVAAGREDRVEAALALLPEACAEGAVIDMRGPLPALSFASARIAAVEPDAVARAWHTLGLGGTCDAATLQRHWRRCASAYHPDHGPIEAAGPAGESFAAALQAYHLIRDLSAGHHAESWTMANLLGQGGLRLIVPSPGRRGRPAADDVARAEAVS